MTVEIGLLEAKCKVTVGQDGRLNKSYTHKYIYETDENTRPTFGDIAADLGIAPGSPYGDDTNATAGEAEIEHLTTRPPHCKAEITITWSTGNPVPAEDSTDPATVRTLWSVRPTIQQRYITFDRNKTLIVNGAKQPFDGGLPADVRLGQAVAKLKIANADFDYSLVMKHSGKINNATFLGGAAGTVQVDIEADEAVEGSYHFWNVVYTFNYDPLGWQPKTPDAGFYQLDADGKLQPIRFKDLDPTSTDSTRVPEPEPLNKDNSGRVVKLANRPTDCGIVTVDYFESLDFTTLPGMS